MELIGYLKEQAGKTLEFKEKCSSLPKIVQTVAAFANTAGGTLIIGVRDKTKDVVGLSDPLKEEERLIMTFDQQPCTIVNSEGVDSRAASEFFSSLFRGCNPSLKRQFVEDIQYDEL